MIRNHSVLLQLYSFNTGFQMSKWLISLLLWLRISDLVAQVKKTPRWGVRLAQTIIILVNQEQQMCEFHKKNYCKAPKTHKPRYCNLSRGYKKSTHAIKSWHFFQYWKLLNFSYERKSNICVTQQCHLVYVSYKKRDSFSSNDKVEYLKFAWSSIHVWKMFMGI